MASKHASEFARRLSVARRIEAPFTVEAQLGAAGEWKAVETHAALDDAIDAYYRAADGTRNTPLRIIDKHGSKLLGSSGSVSISRRQVPGTLLALARFARWDRRQRDTAERERPSAR
jgi:hypothetical protein